MVGTHFIKGWARSQNHVTLSSAEAELGVQAMLRDWGRESATTLYADSSAALAIAKRKGAGKLRHMQICTVTNVVFLFCATNGYRGNVMYDVADRVRS